MAKHPVRGIAKRLATRLDRWSRNETWELIGDPMSDRIQLRRRRPCVFDDVDNFSKFLAAVQALHATEVHSTGGTNLWPVTNPTAAETVANLGRRDRLSITVDGQMDPGGGWSLTLDRHGPVIVGLWHERVLTERWLRRVADEVDRFTRPVRRLAADYPVVQPINMVDAIQQEHDREITRRSVVWGLVAGGIAGPVMTGLITWLVSALGR